jgi:hypothetical protein
MTKQIKYALIAASIIALNHTDVRAETESAQGPDGRPIHETSCQSSSSDCYKEARATCRGNFQVLDSYSKSGGIFADAIPGPITWYHVTYACGASDGRVARFPHQGGIYEGPRAFYLNCDGSYYNVSCGGFR